MRNINRVTLIGQLTADPQQNTTASGTAVTTFSVATNYSWKNTEEEWQEGVDFHRVVAWSAMAEKVASLYKKGESVFLEGKLRTRQWVDDEGHKRFTTEIVAKNMLPMSSAAAKQKVEEFGEEVSGVETEIEGAVTVVNEEAVPIPA